MANIRCQRWGLNHGGFYEISCFRIGGIFEEGTLSTSPHLPTEGMILYMLGALDCSTKLHTVILKNTTHP